jgi:hypothetical protein
VEKRRDKIGKQALEDNLGKIKPLSGRESTKMKFMASSSRGVFTSTKNSRASKVKQRLQVNGIRLGTSIPDNITIVKVREDTRLEKREQKGTRL